MFCMSVNEVEGSRLGFLSILRKIGPLIALILMLTALLLLIWIMRTTYASLLKGISKNCFCYENERYFLSQGGGSKSPQA
ncbi:MAG: hypothetical protein ACYS17_16680 [Planctomycetota bacterium]|jgi:hypothetical protein